MQQTQETCAVLHLIAGGPAHRPIHLAPSSVNTNNAGQVVTTLLADARDRQVFAPTPTPLWERAALYLLVGGVLLVPVGTVVISLTGPSLSLAHSTVHISQLAIAVLGVTLSGLAWLLLRKEDKRKLHMGPLQHYRARWHDTAVAKLNSSLLQTPKKESLPVLCQQRLHAEAWLNAAKQAPLGAGLPLLILLAGHNAASELATSYDPPRLRIEARLDAVLTLNALYELLEQPPEAIPSKRLLKMPRASSLDELRLDILLPRHHTQLRRALESNASSEELLPCIRRHLGFPRLPKPPQ